MHFVREDLEWWLQSISVASQKIREYVYALEIYTDAFSSGWGAYYKGKESYGFWNDLEKERHMNYLELLVVFHGLKCFADKNFIQKIVFLELIM